jgi:hypothetical protein
MKLRPGLLLATALLILTATSSCRHDYICQCEISYSGSPGLPDTLIREYDITDTKKKAQKLCEQNSSDTENGGIRTIENCYLY